MANANELISWVRAQYYQIGLDSKGKFIGKKAFKEKLITSRPLSPADEETTRIIVNELCFGGKLAKADGRKERLANLVKDSKNMEKQTPKAATLSSPVDSQTTRVTRSSTAEAKKQSSSVFDFKVPSLDSSDSGSSSTVASSSTHNAPSGEPFRFESPAGTERKFRLPQSVKAKLRTKSPNSNNTEQLGQSLSKVEKHEFGSLEVETGGVIVHPLAESSAAGQSSSSQKVNELRDFFDARSLPNGRASDVLSMAPNLDDQFGLLHLHDDTENPDAESAANDIKNAVLFPASLLEHDNKSMLPQYGLLGSCNMKEVPKGPNDPRIFLNTNIPFSAFICGVQGSGKSHTTSCLIENSLIRSPMLGILQKPLSALVFHYGEATSRLNFKPSEVAFLASPSPNISNHPRVAKIHVLVSPSNYLTLKPLYSRIPGVTIGPFKIPPKDLNVGTMLTLMSVDTTESAPLYMSQVTKILRDMASKSSKPFDYLDFKRQLADTKLDRKQVDFLTQRLDLLESFLDLKGSSPGPTFEAGTITIMDLSCPFVDVNTACVLFKIGMGMYLESTATTGKLIAVDEAHKYMTDTPASKALTESLLSVIRQQRHCGARVIISTQEPTISPQLIDLCSITVIHRFSSPDWFSVLRRHISIVDESNGGKGVELFQKIVSLRTGEALVFAPSAMVNTADGEGKWVKLSDGILNVRVRKRVTWDGGRSVVAVPGG